jgi:hypothetical protein
MSCMNTVIGCAALLALPLVSPAQIVLLADQRHVEMSANGDAGIPGQSCDDADEVRPQPAFSDLPLSTSVACQTAATSAAGTGEMRCLLASDRLAMRGNASALAASIAEEAAASVFATSHYIVRFRLESATPFRFSARLTTMGGEAIANLRRVGVGGATIFSREVEGEQAELVFRTGGGDVLEAGDYRLEVEGSALIAALGVESVSGHSAYDGLFVVGLGAACIADHDVSGAVDSDDLMEFIADFFDEPRGHVCDVDGSGQVDPDDLTEFITAYFVGC